MLLPDNLDDTFLEEIDKALVAIIVGENFSENYINNLKYIKEEFYPNAKLFQMKWDSKGYFRVRDLNSTEELRDCSEVLHDYLIEM